MCYRVTAYDKKGVFLWTTEVAATCFESAIGLATRGARMQMVHSLHVSKV
jgi:hypothetical protein